MEQNPKLKIDPSMDLTSKDPNANRELPTWAKVGIFLGMLFFLTVLYTTIHIVFKGAPLTEEERINLDSIGRQDRIKNELRESLEENGTWQPPSFDFDDLLDK